MTDVSSFCDRTQHIATLQLEINMAEQEEDFARTGNLMMQVAKLEQECAQLTITKESHQTPPERVTVFVKEVTDVCSKLMRAGQFAELEQLAEQLQPIQQHQEEGLHNQLRQQQQQEPALKQNDLNLEVKCLFTTILYIAIRTVQHSIKDQGVNIPYRRKGRTDRRTSTHCYIFYSRLSLCWTWICI